MKLIYGVHGPLEQAADEYIRRSLAHQSREAKSDILTAWKEQNRKKIEIYMTGGVPDESLRRGQFTRARNRNKPYLNSCEGAFTGHRASGQGMDVGLVESYEVGDDD